MLHDAADWAVIAQAIVAAAAAIVALKTIKAAGDENRKWKTLEVCGQYEFNDRISSAADALRTAFKDGSPAPAVAQDLHNSATIVLNYLDGIAIGVNQGLYIEQLAKDHLRHIVEIHVTRLLDSTVQHKIGLVRNNFRFLVDMNQEWTRDKPYYTIKKGLLPYR